MKFITTTLTLAALSMSLPGTSGFQPGSLHRATITSLSSRMNQQQRKPSTLVKASTQPGIASSDTEVDFTAISKYAIAGVTELGLFSASFFALDTILSNFGMTVLPTPATWLLFYAISLKSRVFNPLNNDRPDRKKAMKDEEAGKGFKDRVMPKWTPPGVVFPIMWLLIIAPLRATSSTIIVNELGGYFDPASIMCLILHLTIGDIWNTINNTEKRYGTSVVGVSGVFFSAAFAAYQYYQVDPLAGKILALPCIWLTIASSLIIQTWRLNPVDGEKDSLLPTKKVGEDSITKFTFE